MFHCGLATCDERSVRRAQALLATGQVRLAGVWVPDPDEAARLAARLGVPPMPSLEDLCAQAQDGLLLGPRASAHLTALARAHRMPRILAGDFPLGLTAERCLDLVHACQRVRTRLAAWTWRGLSAFRAAKAACEAGEIGAPQMLRLRVCQPPPPGATRAALLWTVLPPALDYASWMLGPVARVYAQAAGQEPGVVLCTARCEGGRLAHLEANWAQHPGAAPHTALELAGDRGLLTFDSRQDVALQASGPSAHSAAPQPHGPPPLWAQDPAQHEAGAFLALLRGEDSSILPTPQELVQSLWAAEAVARSLAGNAPQPVPVPGGTSGLRR